MYRTSVELRDETLPVGPENIRRFRTTLDLTGRELNVLEHLAQRKSNKEINSNLKRRSNPALRSIFRKLNVLS